MPLPARRLGTAVLSVAPGRRLLCGRLISRGALVIGAAAAAHQRVKHVVLREKDGDRPRLKERRRARLKGRRQVQIERKATGPIERKATGPD
eukprot:6209924-Pleurochrysis_carterae.AAC.1